jgi:hypothetical protein
LRGEINGTEGDLVLTAANGNLQVADLRQSGGRGEDCIAQFHSAAKQARTLAARTAS